MNPLILKKNIESANRFHNSLASNDGEAALKYLYSRKISYEIISKFKLGWCPLNDPNVYMRGRITVPLKNTYGEILAFAGRIPTIKENDRILSLYDGEVIQYKRDGKNIRNKVVWWHEPLAKRNFLYGIDKSWKYIQEENSVIVVEGEFDLWACYQNGMRNVVSILGSAFTIYHIGKLLGLCDNIIIMLDSDPGGNTGWDRALEIYQKTVKRSYFHFNFYRMMLPENYDPFLFIYEYGISPLKQSYSHIVRSYSERVPF